ncbi:MAG: acetylglutamate kinase [Lentisphaerae bacterium]|nr:acetylglutamate kinase [Lentisphaerota bacterium]
MKNATDKAAVLVEALPYIRDFRGAVVVVKFGGSAMEDPARVRSVLQDVAFLECVGLRMAVVHGGGKAITRGMQERGIKARFVHGLRVTCERTIEVVEKVIKGDVNPRLVQGLREFGARAEGLHGEKIFRATRQTGTDPDTGEKLDWGFVGEPGEVDVAPVLALLENNTIPVITPLGMGPDGRVHNMNADVAAAAVARALRARKLAFLSDVPGLLRDPGDPESLLSTVRVGEVDGLIARGVISGGMLPKIRSCVEALRAGVRKVHMIDGRMPHALLLEIFTDKGVGTEIVNTETVNNE